MHCLGTLATDSARQLDVLQPNTTGLKAALTEAKNRLTYLGHDSHALGVDGAQVCVLEETDEVGLRCLLQGQDSVGLEAQIGLEVLTRRTARTFWKRAVSPEFQIGHSADLCNLSDEPLERQLADEELSGLLELANFAQRDGAGTEPVRLLDACTSRNLEMRLTMR